MIPNDGWLVHIQESPYDWRGSTVRVLIFREGAHGRYELLNRDGTATVVEPGTAPTDDAGFEIPRGALAAIGEACNRFMGELPSTAEVRVLREWLTVEKGRVDSLLKKEVNP